MTDAIDSNEKEWEVWRTDDNGNQFKVGENLTRKEAEEMVSRFEAKGHKQTYWITKTKAPESR